MDYKSGPIDWPPGTQDYSVTLNVGEVNGRLECVSVTVQAVREGCVVSGSTLRDIPVARLMAAEVRELRKRASVAAGPHAPLLGAVIDGVVTEAVPPDLQQSADDFWGRAKQWADELAPTLEKSGRYPPEHWEHVAEVYRAATHWQRNPTAFVGEHYGVSRSAAAKWVSRARDRGLLPPGRIGRADPPEPRQSAEGETP